MFLVMNNTEPNSGQKEALHKLLLEFGFEETEAKIYASLLKPDVETTLDIARDSDLNRTTVYRKIDEMIKRGIVTEVSDMHGTHLAVVPPASLGKLLVEEEAEIESRRELLPELAKISDVLKHDADFDVRTFSGESGVRQMLWNELSADTEICFYGHLLLQNVVGQPFAEKWRNEVIQRKIMVREIQFGEEGQATDFTELEQFHELFEERELLDTDIVLRHQISIYNNVVAIYNWKSDHFTGVEIHSSDYANFQRSIFADYWEKAKPVTYSHQAKE
ncbi:MAG: hypothetical protein A2542_00305 [Parcubacteria group bacterium RIFOXYD2_FULL_52_8]|nr:MAG: hypothetical protein A2542_00305 [Parcubacteria group bacterium RIFOXYD2_FULL_52_8]